VKVGWETKPLSEVCTFKPPKSEARAKLTSVDEVSFVPMEHLGIGNKELKISGTRLLSEVAGSYTYFAEGDVLLAKITPCFENGKLGIARNLVNGVGFGSSEYIVIRPSPEVDADFLYHFLDRATFREEGAKQMTGAVGHKRVPKEYVEGALIPVPTMEEQRRIVTLLDEAFADIATAKAKAEKNLQNARDFFYGQLQAIFQSGSNSWSSSTLGQTYDVRDGTHDSPKYQAEGYPLITSKNLKREGLSFDDVKLIAELDYAKINERSAVHQGDVLLAMIGTIGNPTVVEIEPNFAIKNVALLKVPKTQNSYFLQYYLSTPSVIAKMQSEAKGTTQKFVGLGYLRTFPVSIPTLTEQQKIVEKLDELRTESDRLESIYRQKLTALDDLKKSLLHQAFSGQL
jgi:type I restriction enzyme S subunit